MQVSKIEKDSVRRSNDGQAVTFWIKSKSHAGRKAFPIVGLPGIGIWNPAFTLEVNARRRLGIDRTRNALVESGFVEEGAYATRLVW